MKNLSLFKIIVFYLAIGIAVCLIWDCFIDLVLFKIIDKNGLKFNLFKEFFFLAAAAFTIYFSVRIYQKNNVTSQLNYQKLFNVCPLPMYIMAKGSLKILAVNQAMIKLYGYTEKEFIAMTALDIRPEEERARVKEFLELYGETVTDSGTWLHKKKSGDLFYVEVTFQTLPLSKEDTYLVMITDIDKSLSDERKLSDLLHLYETVNKATHDVIWDYDLIADKLNWMQGYDEVYGYTELIGLNNFWVMPKVYVDDRAATIASFRKILEEKQKDWFIEYRYTCANGNVKYVRDRGYMIFDKCGNPVRMIGALQDIDKQKKYEDQLLNQNEQLKEIAWLNSHQVRRPLSNIMGLINLIKDAENKREDLVEFIDLLIQSSRELDTAIILINQQTVDGKSVDFQKNVF